MLENVDEINVTRQAELSCQMRGALAAASPLDENEQMFPNIPQEQSDPSRRPTATTDLSGSDFPSKLETPEIGQPWERTHLIKLVKFLQEFEGMEPINPSYVSRVLTDIGTQEAKNASRSVRHVSVPKAGNDGRLILVGDTHGQLEDVLWILYKNGLPSLTVSYLFNGDIADRGKNALEIFMIIFVGMLVYPENVCINRGNHEDATINMDPNCGGFYQEVFNRYGQNIGGRLWDEMIHMYTLIPLASIIDDKIFVVHGGLSRQNGMLPTLKTISLRKTTLPEMPRTPADISYVDAMWSDPQDNDGICPSTRGPTLIQFGPDITKKFCEENGIDLIIRSHQPPRNKDGAFHHHDNKLITVFSASNYCGWYGNRGAVLVFSPDLSYKVDRHFSPTFESMKEVDIASDRIRRFSTAEIKQTVSMEIKAQRTSQSLDPERDNLRQDIRQRLARLIVEHKQTLWSFWFLSDVHTPRGTVTHKIFMDGLDIVFDRGIPWGELGDITRVDVSTKRIDYLRFLRRFQCVIKEDDSTNRAFVATTNWMEVVLRKLYSRLMRADLGWSDLFSRFDSKGSGLVCVADFHRELVSSGSGALSEDQTSQLLRTLSAYTHQEGGNTVVEVDVVELLSRLETLYTCYKRGTRGTRISRSSTSLCASLLRSFGKAVFNIDANTRNMGQKTPAQPHVLMNWFKQANRDGTGKLTRSEFAQAIRNVVKQYPSIAANLHDIEEEMPSRRMEGRETIQIGDFSSLKEFIDMQAEFEDRSLISDHLINELFDFADVTGDGSINYLEFLHSFQPPDISTSHSMQICLMEQICTTIFLNKGALLKTFGVTDAHYTQKIGREDFRRVLRSLNTSLNSSAPPLTAEQINILVDHVNFSSDDMVNYQTFLDAFQVYDTEERQYLIPT